MGSIGALGGGRNPLIRVVGRAPFRVRTKLLAAFAVIVALLVVIAVLGLRVLGQSNARAEELGTLQLRAATYQTLQTQAQQLRQLLAIRAAQDPALRAYLEGQGVGPVAGRGWSLVDVTISAALSQLGPATNESRFGFVPPPGDEAELVQIRADYQRFSSVLARINALDTAGAVSKRVRPLLTAIINADNDLGARTDRLASTTGEATSALIAQNGSSYAASRNLFVAVGVASVVLALLLGFAISRSLIDPIRRTEARLAEIAAGDFTTHIEIDNRDELGSLAVNLNRMNDELRRLYEELESVSRHKSQFLAHMSHELRTPLNAIIGFSELLEQQLAGELNEQQLGYVGDVLDAGRHLLSLINEILDLSKVEAGKMDLDRSAVSLRDVLESGVTMHAARADREGIRLELDLHPEDITVRADERRLRQVVFNLVSNAVKSTPPGGRVDLSARLVDGFVEVAVADTGPGVPAEEREAIFEEFRQGRENAAEGTGLGLPLSRKLIELHGGRLWLETTGGSGSTFLFVLPAEAAGAG